jgi:hypothetical protein
MPRKIRFNLPGVPRHVIQRGNNREPCFFSGGDYRRYLDDLRKAAEKYACAIHAYVLMTNHVHLLVTGTVACVRRPPFRVPHGIGCAFTPVLYFRSSLKAWLPVPVLKK